MPGTSEHMVQSKNSIYVFKIIYLRQYKFGFKKTVGRNRTASTVLLVQLKEAQSMSRGSETRIRILDVAQESILAKGFDATSIEEIVASAEITKSGFFYHFKDKNALAHALIERHIVVEDELFDDLLGRAKELSDDPLQRVLIGLKLLAELIEDMPNGHPGCIVATAAYQDRLFNKDVRAANKRAVLGWRERFRSMLDDVVLTYPMQDDVDLDHLADMFSSVAEGGIVMSRALDNPKITSQQILLLRSYIKLLFQPAIKGLQK